LGLRSTDASQGAVLAPRGYGSSGTYRTPSDPYPTYTPTAYPSTGSLEDGGLLAMAGLLAYQGGDREKEGKKERRDRKAQPKQTPDGGGDGGDGRDGGRVRKSKKRHFTLDDDEEEEKGGKHAGNSQKQEAERLKKLSKKVVFPPRCLFSVAPEVLMGGPASAYSSTYCAAAVAGVLLTGKMVIKNALTEERQVQYAFKVLGTPKVH
ncbi:hypothetical protein B484DRAFT_281657, partial [Ochromonadaceae sp. CCMP2298]